MKQSSSITLLTANQANNKPNLLLAATGSVASIKIPQLYSELSLFFNVRVILTKHAKSFVEQQFLIEKQSVIYYDHMEWDIWKNRGDPVLHIELRKWANFLLVAPLSANSLAKISNGLCDNLLTLVCRAWEIQIDKNSQDKGRKSLKKPVFLCPAMNTMMYQHPITEKQINTVTDWGFQIIGPISKTMMCGDVGNGAMSVVSDIVKYVVDRKNEMKQEERRND